MKKFRGALHKAANVFFRSIARFREIDGFILAAAFAHYAFLSLFPLIVLSVAVASIFVNRQRASTKIINYIEAFLPIGVERQDYIFEVVTSLIPDRGEASGIALLILIWAAANFFTTLIQAVNRAWGANAHVWWRLSLKSFGFIILIAGVVSLGMIAPILVRIAKQLALPEEGLGLWIYEFTSQIFRFGVAFLSLSLFYKYAPRRVTFFGEVWTSALIAAVLLQISEAAFGAYLRTFSTLNAVYGAFGGIVALLLWIYVSGCIFIFGACLCASRAAGIRTATNEGIR